MRLESTRSEGGSGGKFGFSLFLLIFLGFSVIFWRMAFHNAFRYLEITKHWQKVPCHIISSGVDTSNIKSSYKAAINYSYQFDGKTYKNDTIELGYSGSKKYASAEQLAAKYGEDSTASCLINPLSPAESTLIPPGLGSVIGMFAFITVFTAFPLFLLACIWVPLNKFKPKTPAVKPENSRRATSFVFTAFLLMGSIFSIFSVVVPAYRLISAKYWQQVPCKIINGTVRSHSGSKGGTTYSIDILYEYRFNEQIHRSDTFNYSGGSSSGYEGKRRIVDRYLSDPHPVCYVNPDRPDEAMLSRNFDPSDLFGLFPLVFVGIGAGGLLWIHKRNAERLLLAEESQAMALLSEAKHFSTEGQQIQKAIFLAVFTVVVNGVIFGVLPHQFSGISLLMMIPLGLVGLFLAFIAFLCFVSVFGPRVYLTVQPGILVENQPFEVQWTATRPEKIKNLRLWLKARQTFADEKNCRTIEHELFATDDPELIAHGGIKTTMPDTIPCTVKDDYTLTINVEIKSAQFSGTSTDTSEFRLKLKPQQ